MAVAEFKQPVEIQNLSQDSSPIELTDLKPKITVIGVGGAGGNAVNNMIRSELQGVQFIVCNTDAQALTQSLADRRIQLGSESTKGLGAGSRAEVGRAAAEESIEQIISEISNSNMVFITAGMGGGTGTGAAPVIAKAARERGILTVAVVTKPFKFEGNHRMRTAEQGIEDLSGFVDTLIIIPNQNLFRIVNENTSFLKAFEMVDNVLYGGVRSVTDLIIMPGLINLDFADIRSVMQEMGKAMMGTGEASGENRAVLAAEAAISNPLLDDVSMKGAQGVLINITGGFDMTLYEADEAANRIREEVDADANIIFGSTFDEKMNGTIRVSVVATGIETDTSKARIQRYLQEQDIRQRPSNDETLHLDATVEEPHAESATSSENITKEAAALSAHDRSSGVTPTNDHITQNHFNEANMHTVHSHSGAPHMVSPQHEGHEAYYQARFQPAEMNKAPVQKKGFFSRFADTVRGGLSREERAQRLTPDLENIPSADERARYFTEITENKNPVSKNVHDIPAYLRRNNEKK